MVLLCLIQYLNGILVTSKIIYQTTTTPGITGSIQLRVHIRLASVLDEQLCDLRHERIVRVGIRQQGGDGEQHLINNVYIYIYTHTYTHTYKYIHIYIQLITIIHSNSNSNSSSISNSNSQQGGDGEQHLPCFRMLC